MTINYYLVGSRCTRAFGSIVWIAIHDDVAPPGTDPPTGTRRSAFSILLSSIAQPLMYHPISTLQGMRCRTENNKERKRRMVASYPRRGRLSNATGPGLPLLSEYDDDDDDVHVGDDTVDLAGCDSSSVLDPRSIRAPDPSRRDNRQVQAIPRIQCPLSMPDA